MEMRVYLWENVDAEFDICQKKKRWRFVNEETEETQQTEQGKTCDWL